VLLIGGSTGKMLEALEVIGDAYSGPYGEINVALAVYLCSTASFTALDRNYLTPIFTSKNDVSGKDILVNSFCKMQS
ncbi:hypothetical protein BHE74_00048356, partial [Ensete ventricosum]